MAIDGFDGLLKLFDRFKEAVLIGQNAAEVIAGEPQTRLGGEGATVKGRGAVPGSGAGAFDYRPEIVEGFGIARVSRDGGFEGLLCLGETLRLSGQDTEVVVRFGVAGLQGDRRLRLFLYRPGGREAR